MLKALGGLGDALGEVGQRRVGICLHDAGLKFAVDLDANLGPALVDLHLAPVATVVTLLIRR